MCKKVYKVVIVVMFMITGLFLFSACDNNNNVCENHNWQLNRIITKESCEIDGIYEYKCTICNEIEISTIKATGHKLSDWIIDTEPTCVLDGMKHKECLNCHTKLEEEIVPATGHNFKNNECSECGERKASEGLFFQLNGNTYTVYSGTCMDTNVIIPSFYEGIPVTNIGAKSFWYNEQIESVKFMENPQLITIEESAFQGCSNLKSFEYPSSLKIIGTTAFFDCVKLEDGIFNNGLEKIGVAAFKGANLINIDIPESLQVLGASAFELNNNVNNIIWRPQNVGLATGGGYKKNYFDSCKNLTIGENVEIIPAYLFFDIRITNLIIPKNVKEIGESAFYYTITLIIIEDANSVWKIGKNGGGTTVRGSDAPDFIAEIYNSYGEGVVMTKISE